MYIHIYIYNMNVNFTHTHTQIIYVHNKICCDEETCF